LTSEGNANNQAMHLANGSIEAKVNFVLNDGLASTEILVDCLNLYMGTNFNVDGTYAALHLLLIELSPYNAILYPTENSINFIEIFSGRPVILGNNKFICFHNHANDIKNLLSDFKYNIIDIPEITRFSKCSTLTNNMAAALIDKIEDLSTDQTDNFGFNDLSPILSNFQVEQLLTAQNYIERLGAHLTDLNLFFPF
jgi:hypothetical protein